MSHNLTNLLPNDRVRALRRSYFARLATTALLFLSVLVIVSGVLLVPSYLFAVSEVETTRSTLTALEAQLSSSEEQDVLRRLSELERTATYLSQVGAQVSASAVFERVLTQPRGGIIMTGFTYAPPSGRSEGKVTVTGVAASRDALRRYQTTLSTMPGVTSAELPISAYAQETNISFTITLTGSFTPS